MDVSIIIVNYNTKQLLINCIDSIYNFTKEVDYEIIVSDNGSTDGSVEILKSSYHDIILIENNKNLGFGAANNKGLAVAKGKYIFYLNSDTVLLNNAIKYFFDYFENFGIKENIGALGCNLLDENLNLTHSGSHFPSNNFIIKNLFADYKQVVKRTIFFFVKDSFSFTKESKSKLKSSFYIGNIDYITGADLFLLNNKDAFYDENFFLYFEDTDINKRLDLQGKKRLLIDGPKIQHLEHKSNKIQSKLLYYASFSKIHFTLSSIKYMRKYSNNIFLIFISKLLVTFEWITPFLLRRNYKYLKQLWKI